MRERDRIWSGNRDLRPLSSRPCRAYTIGSTRPSCRRVNLNLVLTNDERRCRMSQHLVVIAQFRDFPSAGLAQSTLEAAGVRCFLENHHTIAINWLYSNALGGVKLLVVESDAEKAREVLQEQFGTSEAAKVDAEESQPESACPKCGSREIKEVNYKRRFSALSLLFGLPLLVFGKRHRCKACGHRWK